MNPNSVTDIRAKITKTLNQPKNEALGKLIKERYLWQNTAEQTIAAYEAVGYRF